MFQQLPTKSMISMKILPYFEVYVTTTHIYLRHFQSFPKLLFDFELANLPHTNLRTYSQVLGNLITYSQVLKNDDDNNNEKGFNSIITNNNNLS